jgi:hypothetical protein
MTPNTTGGYDGVVHVVAGNGGQALNNASDNGFPSAKYVARVFWGNNQCRRMLLINESPIIVCYISS